MTFGVGAKGALLAAAGAAALGLSSAASAQQTRERPDPVQAYLSSKTAEFQASERAATARRSGAHATALYNMLRDKRPFAGRSVQGRDEAQRGQVDDALVRSAAYFLASTGMTPDRVRALQASGLDPLAAAARSITGGATLEDMLTLSELAGRVRIVSNDPAGEDAVERRVVVEFTEVLVNSLRGDAAPGRVELRVPLPQPLAAAPPGEEFIVFLSSELSAFRKAAGRRSQDGNFAEVAAPFAVTGDRVVATVPGQETGSISTYSAAKAFAGRHQALAQ
jgi:hypothetical protein